VIDKCGLSELLNVIKMCHLFGFGGLFPLFPPEGLPVVLGPLAGRGLLIIL